MTIDVGYAHLMLPDGTELDFVDVPGHDRLVGTMLVGAGEIDAALLVVAADDGLRAQTHEHLDLLDALDVRHALVAITKADLVDAERTGEVCEDVAARLASTALAGAPIVVVSGTTGEGIEELRPRSWDSATGYCRSRLGRRCPLGRCASPMDRDVPDQGSRTVVTGTLRGGALARGANLRIVPGDDTVRVREVAGPRLPVDEWLAVDAPRWTSRATRQPACTVASSSRTTPRCTPSVDCSSCSPRPSRTGRASASTLERRPRRRLLGVRSRRIGAAGGAAAAVLRLQSDGRGRR